jgi:trans-2,3-dihydro-3-hydroxyanthranilate isomerase
MNYYHVDVFSPHPFSGNSLTVFPDSKLSLDSSHFSSITREMRHFESIFLSRVGSRSYSARVFDLLDELPFAGHPVIGAACVLHFLHGESEREPWSIQLPTKTVEVITSRRGGHYYAELNQGTPEFFNLVPRNSTLAQIVAALSLEQADLHNDLPAQVVSTGLRYLILPIRQNLGRARIVVPNFEELLALVGAEFVYVLQPGERLEGRHWNNDGVLEDIATGSGAGCVAAYLVRQGYCPVNKDFILNQGRFVGRPSRISLRVNGGGTQQQIMVGGEVTIVGEGRLHAMPGGEAC